jgi:hypothetical protein
MVADWVDEVARTDTNRPDFVASIYQFGLQLADAVLRVLAEHGDDEKLREIEAILAHPSEDRPWRDIVRFLLDGLRAAVAARDAAVEQRDDAISALAACAERAERAEAARDAAVEVTERLQVKIRELDQAVVKWHDHAERAEADLAAARQQLDQVRALHQPQKRWQHPDCEGSFASRQEALDWDDCDPDDLTFFTVCLVCGEIEMSNSEGERDYMEAMWPCATAKALGLGAPARPAGHDETGQ